MDQEPHPPILRARGHSRSSPVLPPPFLSSDISNNMVSDVEQGSERTRSAGEIDRGHNGAATSDLPTHLNSVPMPALRLSSSVSSDDTLVAGSHGTIRNRASRGHTYSNGLAPPHTREVVESSRGQTWHDFLRESGGDAAEGPYPQFLDQHRRRGPRLSYVESSTPRALPPAPTAASDRKRRSTAPEPPPTAQLGHYRGVHESVPFTRSRQPPSRPRQRSHAYSASVSTLPSSNLNPTLYASLRQPPLPPLPPLSQQSPRRFSSYHQRSDYFHNESSQDNDIMLPPWQPDSEVAQCPVCNSNFTFFTRKHHCRKCGRVVCARCSPHRITIPRQFIVRAPMDDLDARSSHANESAEVAGFDAAPESFSPSALNPALGGGEEVRVCNPCVPDPNFSPPPRRQEGPPGRQEDAQGSSQPLQNLGRQLLLDRATLDRNVYAVARHSHIFPTGLSSTESSLSSGPRVHSPANSMIFPGFEDDQSLHRIPHTTATPRARSVLNEDELCPVCGRELPPVPTAVDPTTAREQHIAACIDLRLGGSSTANAASRSASGPQTIMSYQKLAYKATEKDCQGDECIMCFEEFMEGEELARLACLCKFHNTCIEQWWVVKGPGSCPTHQLQV